MITTLYSKWEECKQDHFLLKVKIVETEKFRNFVSSTNSLFLLRFCFFQLYLCSFRRWVYCVFWIFIFARDCTAGWVNRKPKELMIKDSGGRLNLQLWYNYNVHRLESNNYIALVNVIACYLYISAIPSSSSFWHASKYNFTLKLNNFVYAGILISIWSYLIVGEGEWKRKV